MHDPDERDAVSVQGRASTWRLIFHRNFGPYFVGNTLSNSGTWFHSIAQAILILRLTHSVFLVGVGNFAQFFGVVVLAPVAGRAADRWDRRSLLILTQIVSAALSGGLAVLTALGWATAPLVIGFTLGLGLLNALAIPTLQALLPNLVDRRELGSAIALTSVTFNVARAVGPVIGALVVEHLGIAAAFGLNSASFMGLVAGLAFVKPRPGAGTSSRPVRFSQSIRIIRQSRRMLSLLAVVALASFTIDPVATLTPFFATRIFGRPDVATGYLIGAFGAGAVTAAFIFPGSRIKRQVEIMPAVAAAGILLFAFSTTFTAGLGALLLAGAGYLSAEAAATTELQLAVDEAQRGLVMGVWTAAFIGIRPFASLIDGAVASAGGVRFAAAIMAAPALLLTIALMTGKLGSSLPPADSRPPNGA